MPDTWTEPLLVGGLAIEVIAVPGRKSVRVTVERDARVIAAVPPGADREALEKLIRPRLPWLYTKLGERRADAAQRPQRKFIDGEGFLYLGRSYRLKTVAEAPSPVALVDGRLRLRVDRVDSATEDLVEWYAQRGRQLLAPRVKLWADHLRAPMVDLVVRPLGYRWGSCSDRGAVNVHWAVMQLPGSLIDYVLVHELAHLHQANHSPDFWHVVSRALPDFEGRRRKLDEWGAGIWLPADR